MNKLQNNLTSEFSSSNIEIIPLFRTPLTLKNVNDQNKNNLNIKNTNLNKLSLNKILNLYIKAFSLYNNNFDTYLNKHNNLDLILQKKNENNLDLKISNFYYILNRIFLQFQLNSLLYNINLK